MAVFKAYSRYYDLLYKEKDYLGEVDYIDSLLKGYAPMSKSILELGCGTGKHAEMLVEKGYCVHGIDLSESMLEAAQCRLCQMPDGKATKLSFCRGDIRNYRIQEKFDSVISLFHVISYQTANKDVNSAFKTAHQHLNPRGVFIFDCWYGPAVLTERPEVRVKKLEDDSIEVTRIAEPVVHPEENVVDVNYHIIIRDKITNSVEQVFETHKMRYFTTPEIRLVFDSNGFEILKSEEWMTGNKPSVNTWGVCYIARKK